MNIQLFKNENFGQVRVILENGEPLFCLVDVCKVLDLTTSKVVQRLEDDVLSKYPILDSLGREQFTNFVTEDGLYDVILDSRKESAKTFRKWVTKEVLPSIRKTGSYSVQNKLPQNFAEALRAYADEVEKNEQLKIELKTKDIIIAEYEPKVSYYDEILSSKDTITITQIAKDYGMSAISMNRLLHDLGIQFKQSGQWMLYQKYAEMGYTKSKTVPIVYRNGEHGNRINTQWTQKGRLFLYELLKKENVLPLIEQTIG